MTVNDSGYDMNCSKNQAEKTFLGRSSQNVGGNGSWKVSFHVTFNQCNGKIPKENIPYQKLNIVHTSNGDIIIEFDSIGEQISYS